MPSKNNINQAQRDPALIKQCRKEARKRGLDPDEPAFKAYCTRLYNQRLKDIHNISQQAYGNARSTTLDQQIDRLDLPEGWHLPQEYRGLSANAEEGRPFFPIGAKKPRKAAKKPAKKPVSKKPAEKPAGKNDLRFWYEWPSAVNEYLSNLRNMTKLLGDTIWWHTTLGVQIHGHLSYASVSNYGLELFHDSNTLKKTGLNWHVVGMIEPEKPTTLWQTIETHFGKPAHISEGDPFAYTYFMVIDSTLLGESLKIPFLPYAQLYRIVAQPYEEIAYIEVAIPDVSHYTPQSDIPFHTEKKPGRFGRRVFADVYSNFYDEVYCDDVKDVFDKIGGVNLLHFACLFGGIPSTTPTPAPTPTRSQFIRELGSDVFQRLAAKNQTTINNVLDFYNRLPADVTPDILTSDEAERVYALIIGDNK